MQRVAQSICFLPIFLLTFGCGDGTPKRPAATTVKGTVSLDGKPMPKGEIRFNVPGEPPKVNPVVNGDFSGEAYEGKNRVEIWDFKDGPPLSTDPKGPPTKVNIIPARYNSQTTLSAEVKVGEANTFKFDITSK